jgi:hypothetical protein
VEAVTRAGKIGLSPAPESEDNRLIGRSPSPRGRWLRFGSAHNVSGLYLDARRAMDVTRFRRGESVVLATGRSTLPCSTRRSRCWIKGAMAA